MQDWNQVFLESYNRLNSQQKQAVDSIEGVVVVNAGPGTGKTQLLSLRVANILRLSDIAPYNILCLSFSEAAARNMRERLTSLIGGSARQINIFTYHGFGNEIINQYPDYFFEGLQRQPIDDVRRQQIVRKIFQDLSFDHELNILDPNKTFIYLKPTLELISNLKKNGISSADYSRILTRNEECLVPIQKVISEFFESFVGARISNKILEALPTFLEQIIAIQTPDNLKEAALETNNFVQLSLNLELQFKQEIKQMVELCLEISKSKPFTEWKDRFLTKNDEDKFVISELVKIGKQKAVVKIYEQYQASLNENSLYDFEDMLMEVNLKLEHPTKKALKYNLQEKYQYILVDEFQDTNGVQLRLLQNLVDTAINEGNPNLLVVGDPDQAVYKFQGALNNNLALLLEAFTDAKIVNLNTNYRSNQDILDLAFAVIEESTDRLKTNKLLEFKL